MKTPFVSICCLTYNHEPYIRQCIDGFLMQKTKFNYEVLIHDDASTDNTAQIVREYEARFPEIIRPIYQKENQYSNGVGVTRVYQFPRAKGKYIAMCEGDDYWIDPMKLQKQVDFLERNPDFSLSVHNAWIKWPKKKMQLFNKTNGVEYYNINDLINLKWFIPTASMVFRRDCLEYPEWTKYVQQGDFALALCLVLKGKIHYLNEPMCVYRKNPGSLSATTSDSGSEFRKLELLSYFDMYTNFIYHTDILKRKQAVRKGIYYKLLKNSGRVKKYLNIDYLIFKLKFLQKKFRQ